MTAAVHDHDADDATVLIHVRSTSLGYRSTRTLYACADCQVEQEAFAVTLPDYTDHRIGHRRVVAT